MYVMFFEERGNSILHQLITVYGIREGLDPPDF